MVEDMPDVPPAVILLLAAHAESKSWVDLRKTIKVMLKDLQEQSIAYEISNHTLVPAQANPLHFEVHLHGGMDPFDGSAGCSDLACRLQGMDRIARSMGLIADRVWITDLISEKFVRFGRVTNAKLDEIVADTLVLARLAPLIFAGIVRFRSPWRPVCNQCIANFENSIEELAKDVASKFKNEAKFLSRKNGNYTLDTGNFFEPSLVYQNILPESPLPKLRDAIEMIAYREIRTAMWASRDASLFGGSVFSNSRIGLAGILSQEGRFSNSEQLLLLDHERSIQIPWVSELNAAQIVELRQETSNALPLFREKMARTLSIDEDNKSNTSTSREFIQELREQAAEVRAELSVTQLNSARFWKTTYGLLGLGVSAYGVATDQVVAGVGGLLPLINLLINHTSGHEKDLDMATRRPGYVLVKAQDLLAHAD